MKRLSRSSARGDTRWGDCLNGMRTATCGGRRGSVPCWGWGAVARVLVDAEIKRNKGIWWMPWRLEAMKDVARCEKPRGGASTR